MIKLHKTASSNFCLEFFTKQKNQGLNILHNNYHFFNKFAEESYSPELISKVISSFNSFKQELKKLDLKMLHFTFSFNEDLNKYTYQYVVRSKKHNNPDFKVDGYIQDIAVPFLFFPSMFADWFIDILNCAPMDELFFVSKGG